MFFRPSAKIKTGNLDFFSTFGKNTVAGLVNQKIKNKWPKALKSKVFRVTTLIKQQTGKYGVFFSDFFSYKNTLLCIEIILSNLNAPSFTEKVGALFLGYPKHTYYIVGIIGITTDCDSIHRFYSNASRSISHVYTIYLSTCCLK